MKKLTFFALLFTMIMLPFSVFAKPTPPSIKLSNTANVEWDNDGNVNSLNFGTFVCKTEPCSVTNPNDWFNYSSISSAVSTGEGTTLVVSPGDTLTFLVETTYGCENNECQFNPEFTLGFTNENYLESIDYFNKENGNNDLDGDEVTYEMSGSKVNFSNYLSSNHAPLELGAITAKVKAGTPDGTSIGLNINFDDAQTIPDLTSNPFVKKAYADEVAQSNVRILVSNPSVATTQTTQILPKTGKTTDTGYLLPIALLTATITFLGYQLVSRRKKQLQ